MSSAELYTPAVLVPAPVPLSFSGDGGGQGAICRVTTWAIASPGYPAVAGELLALYTTSLVHGSVIPPQVAVGGHLALVLSFGAAPDSPGYYWVIFQVPSDGENVRREPTGQLIPWFVENVPSENSPFRHLAQ